MKNKGFTLIEVLIVLIISSSILIIVISSFYKLVKTQALERDLSSIIAIIDRAKSLALNSESASQYGVYFSSSTAVLYKGINYIPTSTSNEIYFLNNRVNISSINLIGSSTNQITFSRITGYSNASGTVSISLKDNFLPDRIIKIYRTGVVEYK